MGLSSIIELRRWIGSLRLGLFPPSCLLCGAPGAAGRDLCAGCCADLPRNTPACPRCAEPLPASFKTPAVCGRCQRRAPSFDKATATFRYAEPLDSLIVALKFGRRLEIAPLLAELMLDTLPTDDKPDALVPVPLSTARLRERGFNQALEIARFLARHLDLPLMPGAVRRIRHAAPQSELALTERTKNVGGAFAAKAPIDADRIVVVDDVMTSGSTANEVARVLHGAGVARVDIWVCGRAQRDPNV